jgi:DNA helicase MCM8
MLVNTASLCKFIHHYFSYCSRLSQDASNVIQQFYLELREKHRSADATPITTRQLESLIRLSEARARLELREEVTREDAEQVVEIMRESLFQRMEDELGNIDFRRGTGSSKAKQMTRFVAHLQKLSERNCTSIFTLQDLYTAARDINMKTDNFEDFVESMNVQNYLIKKGPRTYKLLSSSVN